MYKRTLSATLKRYMNFPAIALLGPRQSGKTTLVRELFSQHAYISFENPLTREFARTDPLQFLKTYENDHGVIIDEFQHVPEILSYLQLDIDTKKRKGYFILTGSQNFLMNQAITQSLAGRVGILTLLPLSLAEFVDNKLVPDTVEDLVFNGCYPRLHDESFTPDQLYPAYIYTYVERDVRQLINVVDLSLFQKFLQLCAARIGNLLNASELAGVCNISVTTVHRWLSVLQASYIIFLLEPHFQNFNKRITKMPKLYFYDTGLACSLLRIPSSRDLPLNPYWGNLFENFIIADLAKQYFNAGSRPPLYFWRDANGRLEVDCIVDDGSTLFPIEIKANSDVSVDFFKGIKQWCSLTQDLPIKIDSTHSFLVYAGEQIQVRSAGTAIPWKESGFLVNRIKKIFE